MIRVLIADDSAFMRKLLSDVFEEDKDFVVVDTARNGQDAVEKVKRLKPDLVTMDVEMPVMDGLTAVEIIMRENPLPIIMVSSLTSVGADATIKALSLGAVDFIQKVSSPISSVSGIKEEILEKCKAAAGANIKERNIMKTFKIDMTIKPTVSKSLFKEKIIGIGTSTGGPRALQEIITNLPGDLPCGVVIVQHMPPGFTKSLATRLDSLTELKVKEAEDNDVIEAGKVFIAPGDYHMTVEERNNQRVIKLNQSPPLSSHRPAVDALFESLAKYGDKVIAAILTGMGSDGAKGIKLIREAGGRTLAEDKSTAVVYGMPKVAVELGGIDEVLPIEAVAGELSRLAKK